MASGVGRGLVKHKPQPWHCTTANQSREPSGLLSGPSISNELWYCPQSRHAGSSQTKERRDELGGFKAFPDRIIRYTRYDFTEVGRL